MEMADSIKSICITFHSKRDHSSYQTEVGGTSSDEMDVSVTQDVEEKNGARIITLKIICKGNHSKLPSNEDALKSDENSEIIELRKEIENLKLLLRAANGLNNDGRPLAVDSEELVNNRGISNSCEEAVIEKGINADIDNEKGNGVNDDVERENNDRSTKLICDTESQTDVKMFDNNAISIEVQTEITLLPDFTSEDVVAKQLDVQSPVKHLREFYFHRMCGKNVEIHSGGKRVTRLYVDLSKYADISNGYTSAFTNRTLEDGEVFQIQVDRIWFSQRPLSIGLIDKSPDNYVMEIDEEMTDSKSAWVYHDKSIYINGTEMNYKYGEGTGFDWDQEVKTLGVMKDGSGGLYFFVNGKNQGLAAKGVPSEVYGFIDLLFGARDVSIVGS